MNSEKKHRLTASHFALYALLRGFQWDRGLRPPTNQNKINNGYRPVTIEVWRQLQVYAKWPEVLQDALSFLGLSESMADACEALRHMEDADHVR